MAGSVPVSTFAMTSPIEKKTVARTARPMAPRVASLAGAPPLVAGITEIFSARGGLSIAVETDGGGLMGAWTISARAWGHHAHCQTEELADGAECLVNSSSIVLRGTSALSA